MIVPANKAGLIIGHHGETLRRIEKLSQTKMQFDQSWLNNELERRVIIMGYPEDIEEARRLVMEKIEEFNNNAYNLQNKFPTIQYMVPNSKVGLVIGRGGEMIKELQEKSGARVFVNPDGQIDPVTGERPINLTGDEESINKAKTLINELIFGLPKPVGITSAGIPINISSSGRPTTVIQIPENCVGAVIGKRAEHLKQIVALSGVKIYIEPTTKPGCTTRDVHISGSPEGITYAQVLINERVTTQQATTSFYSQQISEASNTSTNFGDSSNNSNTIIYQNPNEFLSSTAVPGAYDYSQYYSQYYGNQQLPPLDPNQINEYYNQYYQSTNGLTNNLDSTLYQQTDQQFNQQYQQNYHSQDYQSS
jgi:rRNA processing protein Krr1/Pno1